MKVIIPVFPLAGLESDLLVLKPDKGSSVLDELVLLLANDWNDIIVITDQEHVMELLSAAGIQVFLAQNKCYDFDKQDLLCMAGAFACRFALENRLISKQDTVMVLDYSGPFLKKKIREKAYEQFRDSNCPAAFSVSESRDHPVQLFSHSNFTPVGYEILALREHNDGNLSRPIPMADMLPQFYQLPTKRIKNPARSDLQEGAFTGGENFGTTGLELEKSGYIINRGSWKRFIPNDMMFDTFRAAAIEVVGKPFNRFLCIKREGRFKYELYADSSLLIDNLLFITYSLDSKNGIQPLKLESIDVDDVVIQGRRFSVIGTILPPKGMWGLFIIVNKPSMPNEAPITTPFEFDPPMWKFDSKKNRINNKNGMKVRGRQDFPPIFEVDGLAAIFSAGEFERLGDLYRTETCLSIKTPRVKDSFRSISLLFHGMKPYPDTRQVSTHAGMTGKCYTDDVFKTIVPIIMANALDYIKILPYKMNRNEEDVLFDSLDSLGFWLTRKKKELVSWLMSDAFNHIHMEQFSGLFGFSFLKCCIEYHSTEFWKLLHTLRSRGRFDDVISLINAIAGGGKDYWQADLQISMTYWMMGEFRNALRFASISNRKYKKNPYAYLHMGTSLFCLGLYDKALICFNILLKRVPNDMIGGMYRFAAFCCMRNSKSDFNDFYQQSLEESSGTICDHLTKHHTVYAVCLAHIYATVWMIERNPVVFLQWEDATAQDGNQKLVVEFPSMYLAVAAGTLSDKDSRGIYSPSILPEIDESVLERIENIISLRSEGKINEAIDVCDGLLKNEDSLGYIQIQMGLNMQVKGEYKLALRYLSIAAEQVKNSPWLWYMIGVCHFKLGQHHVVLQEHNFQNVTGPKTAYDIIQTASLWDTGYEEEACDLFERAIGNYCNFRVSTI